MRQFKTKNPTIVNNGRVYWSPCMGALRAYIFKCNIEPLLKAVFDVKEFGHAGEMKKIWKLVKEL